eukprot:910451-Amorphochlora_amoeboformis.AAC.2
MHRSGIAHNIVHRSEIAQLETPQIGEMAHMEQREHETYQHQPTCTHVNRAGNIIETSSSTSTPNDYKPHATNPPCRHESHYHQITKSPNHQITKSPNHQINEITK